MTFHYFCSLVSQGKTDPTTLASNNTDMQRLQYVISTQYDPFLNRAVEQYLTENQEEGTVTMYLWKNQQTVVIG